MQNKYEIRDFVIKRKKNEWQVHDKKNGKMVTFTIEGSTGRMDFNANATDFRYEEALISLCELIKTKPLIVWCKAGGKMEDILKEMPKYFRKVPCRDAFTRMYCSK